MFSVLYADNPWKFKDVKTGGSMTSGAAQKYPCMELDDIHALPVQSLMRANSSLFLWVPTTLKFSHGESTLKAWGYRYVTTIYWNKQRIGMGRWMRHQAEEMYVGTAEVDGADDYAEELLVGVHGAIKPFGCQRSNMVGAPLGEHSEKPEVFREIVQLATGFDTSRRCLEMFGRRQVAGWTVIGNQSGDGTHRDIRLSIRDLQVERAAAIVRGDK